MDYMNIGIFNIVFKHNDSLYGITKYGYFLCVHSRFTEMLQITECIHFSKPRMNTQKVPVFRHAIQGIIMLEDNIENTYVDVIPR